MFKPVLSLDELRTEVVRILALIRSGADVADAEDALQQVLTCAYQAGQIEANNAQLERMTAK